MILLFVDCTFLVDCTFFGAFHVPFEQPAPQPGAAHPSWIAPSSVHSTSLSNNQPINPSQRTPRRLHLLRCIPRAVRTTSPSTRCSAPLVDCTFFGAFHVSFKQPAPQPGAAHPSWIAPSSVHSTSLSNNQPGAAHPSWIAPSSVHSTSLSNNQPGAAHRIYLHILRYRIPLKDQYFSTSRRMPLECFHCILLTAR
jgi:hypothetical protein